MFAFFCMTVDFCVLSKLVKFTYRVFKHWLES